MNKISMTEASKMCKGGEFYLMHIEWFGQMTGYSHVHGTDLQQEHPDCSNVVVNGRIGHWRDGGAAVAVVLDTDFQKEVKWKWEELKSMEQISSSPDSSI